MFRTNSRSQIVFQTDIFRKLTLGTPTLQGAGRYCQIKEELMRSPGEQNCIREGRGGLKVFLFLLPFNTKREKKNMVHLGNGIVWSQELRDPLDQPNITFSKHVTPRKKVKTLPHRWNISFSSVLLGLNVDCGQTEELTCSPTPNLGKKQNKL